MYAIRSYYAIRVKGVQRRIPHDLFTEKQLDNIYQKFPESKNYWTHENTLKTYHLILGLRIYQGLQEQELANRITSYNVCYTKLLRSYSGVNNLPSVISKAQKATDATTEALKAAALV